MITQENAVSPIMHSKKNLGFSIIDYEQTSMYGSYKIMQDHLYKILGISMHGLETLLLLGSYKIMQDLLCIFPRKILEFQCMILKLSTVWILQDNARYFVHLSKRILVFTSMVLKLCCCVGLIR